MCNPGSQDNLPVHTRFAQCSVSALIGPDMCELEAPDGSHEYEPAAADEPRGSGGDDVLNDGTGTSEPQNYSLGS